MVMECHKAYAILMDEASQVVYAANLHYEVGQTVENPVLLQEPETAAPRISVTMKRCIAVAACAVLMLGGGALYYRGNYTPYSSVMVCADEANLCMEVSRSGKVLSVQPLNQDAALLLSDYTCSGKDPVTVTSELIERAVENGVVQKGDTVGVYYQKEKNKDPEQFEKTVEQSIASHELQADVHGELDQAPVPPAAPAEPPVAPAPPDGKEEPPAPPQPGKEEPAPPAPHDPKVEPPAPAEPPVKPETPAQDPAPVTPPEPGTETPPEPPLPPEAPAEEKPAPADTVPVPPAEAPVKLPDHPVQMPPV